MPDAARKGDLTTHGGMITAGEDSVLIGFLPAARVGDDHKCPMSDPGPKPHEGGPVGPKGSLTVDIGYMPAARKGDPAVCKGPPDSISTGEATVDIGG